MDAEPRWISSDAVRAIHMRQTSEHGGDAILRDAGLLESALGRARNLWSYGEPRPDLAALAAAYAFGIIRNHPFVDGNKRTGYVICRSFLIINGRDVQATDADKYLTFYRVAAGEIGEVELADWIRAHLIDR